MQTKRAVLLAAVAGMTGVAGVARGQATYTWDVNGASPTNPADGATPAAAPWVAGDFKWSDGTVDIAWPNTGNEIAVFGNNNGTAGIVYPAFASLFAGITFNPATSGAYNLGGINGGSMTLAGNNPVVTVNAPNATISAILTGTGGFVKQGTGSLMITQTKNTYSGPITIDAGNLNYVEGNTVTATGSIAGTTMFNLVNSTISGATGYSQLEFSNGNKAIGGLGTAVPINVTFAGADPAGDYRVAILAGPNAGHTVSGAISVGGPGEGTLIIGGPGGTSSTLLVSGPITLSGAGQESLQLSPTGTVLTVPGAINMAGLAQGGQLVLGGSSGLTVTGSITAGNNVDLVMNRSNATTGVSFSLQSTVNTWRNTYFQAGLAVLGTSDGMPASTVLTMGDASAAGTATYQMNGFSQTVAGLTSAGTGGTLLVTNTTGTTGTITINPAAGLSYSYGTVAGGPAATIEGNLNVTKTGAGTETFMGVNTYSGLTTVSGGSLVLTSNAFTPETLTGAGGANVTGGNLVFDYSGGGTTPVAQVQAALKGSHDASPAWSSGQIMSSTADSLHELGYNDNGSAVTVAYTLVGDLNLDGKVNADDYALLDRGYASGGTGWVNGDVNYDGVVDQNDYLLVDTTYLATGGAHDISGLLAEREAEFGAGYVSELTAAVPEPTGLMAVAMVGIGMSKRRRRV
ncbi:MAG TPA: autotransporter-associated beta strand repeat-containing protein [Tepidisphaeraceae bacterium]|nr:autotransporter-associated beta strand repeat-containing protein [Tepidisphaeraceae bacterium]